jgi:hypothetical protein
MKVHGNCHCGRIAYEAEVDPGRTTICHCTDCQALTGTAYRVSVPTRVEDFRLLAGEPAIYTKTGSSGAKRLQAFCANCGSPIYAAAAEAATTYGLRTGNIVERAALVPTKQIWCDSALGWTMDIDGVEKHAKEPA